MLSACNKSAVLFSVLLLAYYFHSSVSVPTSLTDVVRKEESIQEATVPILDIPTPVLNNLKLPKSNGLSKEDRLKKLDEKLGHLIEGYQKNPPKKTEPHLAAETEFSQTWNFLNTSMTSRLGVVRDSSCSYPSTEWYSENGIIYSIINNAVQTVLYRFDIPSIFVKDTEKFLDWIVSQYLHFCSSPVSFCLATNGDGDYYLQGISTSGYSACFYVSDLDLVICPAVSWTWDTWYQDIECTYENQFCVGYIDLGVRVFDLEYGAGGVIQAHIGESAATAAEGSVLVKNFCANAFYE